MKILHVINNLAAGGAEKLLTDILPRMRAQGHAVAIFIANDEKNVAAFEERMRENEVRIINAKTSFYNPLLVFQLVTAIKQGNYQVVHAHLFPTQYWLAFASLFIPKEIRLVKTEHSVFNERKDHNILRPLEKWIYGRYHAIIGITLKVKENLSKWIGTNDIVVIPNGVNLDQITQQIHEESTQNKFSVNKNHYNLLMTGRFDGIHKDQPTLMEAVATLPKDVHLYFAGIGPSLEEAQKIAEKLEIRDRVHFLGLRSDVYYLMATVDLNILSTNTEGLSGVALEAMASGTPFIGSDVEGVNDVVPDARFLFPPKHPKALAAKILEIRQHHTLKEALIKDAQEHVKQYEISVMVNNYLHLYTSLLDT